MKIATLLKPALILLCLLVITDLAIKASFVDESSWEMRTDPADTIARADIEQGLLDEAITDLVASYLVATPTQAGPILSDLCLAYILKKQYQAASQLCDLAVEQPEVSRDAYNNRGVLMALQGHYKAAIADFKNASCSLGCPANLRVEESSPDGVIERNLERAQFQLAAMMGADQQE